jgi:hypothetical protein
MTIEDGVLVGKARLPTGWNEVASNAVMALDGTEPAGKAQQMEKQQSGEFG